MIKVSFFYATGEGKRFDIGYYCQSHMPMVKSKLGDALKTVAVEEGLGGGAPNSLPSFVAMGHLYFDSLASFQAAWAPHAADIVADIPNCTNIDSIIQISDVKL